MALTLEDIAGAPNDPEALNQHLIQRGILPAPITAPPAIPTETAMTPRARNIALGVSEPVTRPMSKPTSLEPLGDLGGARTGKLGGDVYIPPLSPVDPSRGEAITTPASATAGGLGGPITLPKLSPVNPARGTPIHALHPDLAAAAGETALKPLAKPTDLSAAPDLGTGAPPPAGLAGAPGPIRPTERGSIEAGMAQHGTTAKEEGPRQLEDFRPKITAEPGTTDWLKQKFAQEDFDRTHGWGTELNHPGTLGKILHGLGIAGQIAGGAIVPNIMPQIPGTIQNRAAREAATLGELRKSQAQDIAQNRETSEEENRKSEEEARGVQTAEARQKLLKEQTEQSLITDAQGNITGYKDPQGQIRSIESAPDEIKKVAAETEAKSIKPTIEKMDNGDVVAVMPGKNGAAPTSQVVYHGDPKLETELTEKTINGKEHKILINKKTGAMIQDIGEFAKPESPTAALTKMKSDEEVVLAYDKNNKAHLMSRADARDEGLGHVSKASPGDIDKANTHHMAVNTLQTQLNGVVQTADALDQNLVQRGIIAQALSHPTDTTMDSLIRSGVMTGATEKTRDYVIAVRALREAGLALPKEITGGARVSEVQASALWGTMPSASSLDSKYALKQAKKFQTDIDRLRQRAPIVRGTDIIAPDERIATKESKSNVSGAVAPPAGKVAVYNPKGEQHFVNADKVDKFLKDPQYKGWTKNAPKGG